MARELVADGLSVCVDCAMIIANGELGQGDADADAEHAARMAARWPGETLVLCGPEDGEEDTPVWFSHSDCDGCGEWLAGDRMAAVAFAR